MFAEFVRLFAWVAVARHPESVPPVAGTFIGPAGQWPVLTVDVQVMAL